MSATEECRSVKASARFDHGPGTLRLQLCRKAGTPWVVAWFELTPEVFTGETIERVLLHELRQLVVEKLGHGPSLTATCPNATIPVGGEVTCRVTADNEAHTVRAGYVGGSYVKLDWVKPATR